MRTCTKCKTTKEASEFYRGKSFKDGLQLWCKDCHRGYYSRRGRELRGAIPQEDWTAIRRERARKPERACIICKITKPRGEFHKNKNTVSGFDNICRTCRPDYDRAYFARLKQDPIRHEKFRKSRAAASRKYSRQPKYQIMRACHRMVSYGLQLGIITKQPCEKCGAVDVQAHHRDYTKPLEVQWLCVPCHTAIHVAERRAKHGISP